MKVIKDLTLVVDKNIIPEKMIENKSMHKIDWLDDEFKISGYRLYIKNYRVDKLILNGKHPNCHPDTNEFCIPPYILKQKFKSIEEILSVLENIIKIFNMDSSYFSIWGKVKYSKMDWRLIKNVK